MHYVRLAPQGKCLLHTEVKVVDDDGTELPWGRLRVVDSWSKYNTRLLEQPRGDQEFIC